MSARPQHGIQILAARAALGMRRADLAKASEHAAQHFSKAKAFNCTVQSHPKADPKKPNS